jgi:hypothetical protein
MFCEAYIEIAGYISREPIFTVTKQGVPYCTFSVTTTNNTSGDKDLIKFHCFCWQGQQYNLIKKLNLTLKDEIVVKGMFSMNATQGVDKPLVNLQCYVNYMKVIRSASAEKAREELNSVRTVEEVPVKKQFKNVNDKEVRIDKNDNPWG